MKKIIIVGGAGYIGSHINRLLVQEGFSVRIYDNLSTGYKENLLPENEFIEGDILDQIKLNKAFQGMDAVIHLAALKSVEESQIEIEKYAQHNIYGSVSLLNAMVQQGIRHLLFSSTAAVYGFPQYNPINEEHPLNPINFYGYTKKVIEDTILWYSQLKNITCATLRYFNAAGYNKKTQKKEKKAANLIPIIMEVLNNKRDKLFIFGSDYPTIDGTCMRDYIHCDDIAHAHLQALHYIHSTNDNITLNLGTSRAFSVKEIISITEKISGKKIPYQYTVRRKGDPPELIASWELARKKLQWKPQYNIEDIIQSTLNIEKLVDG